jgi:hypothetical protein
LLERFHRKISPIAANHVPSGSAYWKRRKGRKLPSYHTGELYDELLSTGSLAAWEAVLAFKVDSGLRFWTFAHKQVVGAISDAAKEHMKGGIAGETRADRWLFNHWNAKPEQLLEATKGFGLKKPTFKSLEEAGEAIKEFRQRYQWQKIDGAELVPAGYQGRSGRFPDDDVPRSYVTAAEIKHLYDFFSAYQLAPHLQVHEPLSRIVDDVVMGKMTLSEARDIIWRTKKRRNLSGSTRRKQSQKRLRRSHGNNCAVNPMSAGRLL